ncbi:MAG: hypothetical protein MZV49_10400 [Rhodopseudomonas palustris]|nr:hypothetical protein [Rhodopseudomonas palustris]
MILGCVGQAGEQANNIARNAVLASKLPESVPGVSVDRQCGSSQQALHFAAQAVMSGTMDVVIAGGVESMTRVPMGLPATLPFKHGFGTLHEPGDAARAIPACSSASSPAPSMLAAKYGLSKDALDDYALASHQRAAARDARAARFEREIVPVAGAHVPTARPTGEMHAVDEGIRFDATLDGIAAVKLLARRRPADRGHRQPDLRRRARR